MRVVVADGVLLLRLNSAVLTLGSGQRLSVGITPAERRRLILQVYGAALLRPRCQMQASAKSKPARQHERTIQC